MKSIIIFASGNGSNAENICRYFEHHNDIRVKALFCNNPTAGVIKKMDPFQVPVQLFDRALFKNQQEFDVLVKTYKPDLIVLAGFLWLIPPFLIEAYPNKIINIHPALLPKFGGKGMYGHHVHEAVIEAKEKEHGITIHFVNAAYDEGTTIFQAKFDVVKGDDAESLAKKISALEMNYFPMVIEKLLLQH